MTQQPDLSNACGLNRMLKSLARAWVADIIRALGERPATRFGALRRNLGGDVSPRVLSVRLKELEALGLVSRMDAGTMPMHVDYSLTATGQRLHAVLHSSEASAAHLGLLDLFERSPDPSALIK